MSNAAHAGALFLDKRRPGWENEINVDRLNMEHGPQCVLGQLHETYWDGLAQLGITGYSPHTEEIRLGFVAPPRSGFLRVILRSRYNALTKAWKRAIADRLQAA